MVGFCWISSSYLTVIGTVCVLCSAAFRVADTRGGGLLFAGEGRLHSKELRGPKTPTETFLIFLTLLRVCQVVCFCAAPVSLSGILVQATVLSSTGLRVKQLRSEMGKFQLPGFRNRNILYLF